MIFFFKGYNIVKVSSSKSSAKKSLSTLGSGWNESIKYSQSVRYTKFNWFPYQCISIPIYKPKCSNQRSVIQRNNIFTFLPKMIM